MPEGYIVFQVYTSRGAIPVVGAYASVTRGSGDQRDLIGFRITNEDGRTEPVSIETPPKGLSMEPGSEKPFAMCDIRVDHPGYYTVYVKDVQIFEGLTSLQQVQMIPLQEEATINNRSESFTVVAQNL